MGSSSKDRNVQDLILAPVTPEAMDTNPYAPIIGMSRVTNIPRSIYKNKYLYKKILFLINSLKLLYSDFSCKESSLISFATYLYCLLTVR